MNKLIISFVIFALSGCTAITITERQMIGETAKFFNSTDKVSIYDVNKNLVTSEFEWKTDIEGVSYTCSGSAFNSPSLNAVYCTKI